MSKPIYDFLVKNNLTSKDFDTFESEYSDPTKVKSLYDFFVKNNLTSKSIEDFTNEHFQQALQSQTEELPPFQQPQTQTEEQKWGQAVSGMTTSPQPKPEVKPEEKKSIKLENLQDDPNGIFVYKVTIGDQEYQIRRPERIPAELIASEAKVATGNRDTNVPVNAKLAFIVDDPEKIAQYIYGSGMAEGMSYEDVYSRVAQFPSAVKSELMGGGKVKQLIGGYGDILSGGGRLARAFIKGTSAENAGKDGEASYMEELGKQTPTSEGFWGQAGEAMLQSPASSAMLLAAPALPLLVPKSVGSTLAAPIIKVAPITKKTGRLAEMASTMIPSKGAVIGAGALGGGGALGEMGYRDITGVEDPSLAEYAISSGLSSLAGGAMGALEKPFGYALKGLKELGKSGISTGAEMVSPKFGGAVKEVIGARESFLTRMEPAPKQTKVAPKSSTERIEINFAAPKQPKKNTVIETAKKIGIVDTEMPASLTHGANSSTARAERHLAASPEGKPYYEKWQKTVDAVNNKVSETIDANNTLNPVSGGEEIRNGIIEARNDLFGKYPTTYNSIAKNKESLKKVNSALNGSEVTTIKNSDWVKKARASDFRSAAYEAGLNPGDFNPMDYNPKIIKNPDGNFNVTFSAEAIITETVQSIDNAIVALEKEVAYSVIPARTQSLNKSIDILKNIKNKTKIGSNDMYSTLNAIRRDLGEFLYDKNINKLELLKPEITAMRDSEEMIRNAITGAVKKADPELGAALKEANLKISKYLRDEKSIAGFAGKDNVADETVFTKSFSNTANIKDLKEILAPDKFDVLAKSWVNNKMISYNPEGNINFGGSLRRFRQNAGSIKKAIGPDKYNQIVDYLRVGDATGPAYPVGSWGQVDAGRNAISRKLGQVGSKANLGRERVELTPQEEVGQTIRRTAPLSSFATQVDNTWLDEQKARNERLQGLDLLSGKR